MQSIQLFTVETHLIKTSSTPKIRLSGFLRIWAQLLCGLSLFGGLAACGEQDVSMAESNESGSSESGAELPQPEIDRRYIAMYVKENGVDRVLLEGSILKLEYDLSNRIWALGFCSRMEGTWQIVDQKQEFVMLRFMDVVEDCPVDKKQQDDWYFDFLLRSPLKTGDDYVFLLDEGNLQMEFFRTYGAE